MRRFSVARLAACVVFVGAAGLVTVPGAKAATCDDYSANRFGFPGETLRDFYNNSPIAPIGTVTVHSVLTTADATHLGSKNVVINGGTQNVSLNPGGAPQEENNYVVSPSRSGTPNLETATLTTTPTHTAGVNGASVYHPNTGTVAVSVASAGDLGISQYVHEWGGEIAEAPLPPGSRPIHFVNCNVVAPRNL